MNRDQVDRGNPGRLVQLILYAAAALSVTLGVAPSVEAAGGIHQFLPDLSHEGAFTQPCGVATDSKGDLYVSELRFLTESISVYAPDGTLITRFVPTASGATPCALAVDSAGDVYAVGRLTDVVRYRPSSYPPTASTTYEADTSINGTGRLATERPVSVAVDPTDQHVLVAEAGVNEVQAFNRPTPAECGAATKFTLTYAPTGQTSGELTCTSTTKVPTTAEIKAALESALGPETVSVNGNSARKTVIFERQYGARDLPIGALEVRKGAGPEAGALISTSTAATDGLPSRIASFAADGTPLGPPIGEGLVPSASYYGVGVYGATGDVYVTDPSHNAAYILNPAGTVILTTITGVAAPEGAFAGMKTPGLAVDQSNGDVLISDIASHGVVDEFDSSGAFVSQLGPEFATPPTGFSEAEPSAIAVDGSGGSTAGNVYVTSGNSAAGSVYAFGPAVFGLPPEARGGVAGEATQTSARLHASVNPSGDLTDSCLLRWERQGGGGSGSASCEPDPGSASTLTAVSVEATGLTAHATYEWSVFIKTPGGTAEAAGAPFVASAPPSATTGAADSVTETEATLHGSADPAAGSAASCGFEYDIRPYESPAESSHGSPVSCSPDPGSAETATSVTASLTGLSPRTTYYYRLVESTDGGTARGAGAQLTTTAPPQVITQGARLGETDATLEAEIRPNGLPTTYRFQYVTEATYERDVEELGSEHGFDHAAETAEGSSLGEDFSNHRAAADVAGLDSGTVYRYRALATSSAGTVAGAAARLMTLDEAGLPDGRGVEMVSPADLGPVGEARPLGANQLAQQASEDGDRIIYPIVNGLPSSTVGGQANYLATRTADGWSSLQITPPSLAPSAGAGPSNDTPARLEQFSPDLDCGIVETFSPIDSDPPVPTDDEAAHNLFVHREGGTTELITPSPPTNSFLSTTNPGYFQVDGISDGCSSVLFETGYRYPGISGSGLYEWSDGQLRDAGVLPSGAVANEAKAGFRSGSVGSLSNVLSSDGSTAFFSAKTSESGHAPNSTGVFARMGGSETVDVSRSDTSAPDRGAKYQAASADGSRVFFLANYGLTSAPSNGATSAECSAGGSNEECDVYEYDLGSEELHDLTATAAPENPKGAVAPGLLGLSEDGSRVYLAAKAQLVPDRGNTYAENAAGSGSYNVYLSEEGPDHQRSLFFVGLFTASATQDTTGTQLLTNPVSLSSQVNPRGTALLFTSRANVTGYDSGGEPEAYLYSRNSEMTRCVSCPPDRAAALPNPAGVRLVAKSPGWPFQAHYPRALSADGETVFFGSVEALAPGGVAGNNNLYEWREGTVSLLMTEPTGKSETPFVDAGSDAEDAFVATSQHLLPSAQGTRVRLYDLRAGGGFPEPPEPPPPCEALAERSCQGGAPNAPAAAAPATTAPTGAGNPATPRPRCAPGKVRRHGRCVSRKSPRRRGHGGHKQSHRGADTKRRGSR